MKVVRIARLALALLAAATCVAHADTGRESRSVSGFDRIEWHAAGELRIAQGNTESLVIEAEKGLLPKIKVEVKAGVLRLGFTESRIETQQPIRFHLTVKTLAGIETLTGGEFLLQRLATPSLILKLGGSGKAKIEYLSARELDVRIDGAFDVDIDRGTVQTQRVEIAGAGRYAAAGLQSDVARISVSGSGDAVVMARSRLDARISGAGQITYLGDPVVTQDVSGAGEVRRHVK